ncbi:outer membrane protein transport protein [Glaesserella parasuis]|uniref:Outer membrane protein transport protein n=1 Tax=Glaesserella parasuis TaxID=738 RepID=A0AAX1M832_GLAPU|nr:outer membrane protein transport protein [Glaesserella parasuis]MCT8518193.1 outer membrane protein transport protein [Glaesserella parasuis]MDG6334587.1 outer membrane protein transport protein [Glaesserella parasuis]MDG6775247.1 outer membrane protein transport protein [Glaesserella parasuis]MDG6808295.1 outer membrane protein transport protein [Glaesserella parasuis]MDG6817608.1 outer membrane protein transport protein [Glaesserella parasuis]
MNKFTKTALASIFTFSAAGASAAAFQLAEVSTSGLGMAYAGNAAVADNASVVATNPALMTKFKQVEISAGGVYVDADVDVEGSFKGSFNRTVNGRAIPSSATGNANAKDIIPSAIVPNLYVVAPISERFAVGGGVNVNYGLKSEFEKTYSAGVLAGKTKLSAVNYNFSSAYDLGYGFSFGAGLNAVHAKATLERHFGALNPMAPTATASRLKGDKWGFRWNVGLTYDINENNRLGVAYHSPVDLRFKGKYVGTQSANVEIPGRLNLELPAYWEISGYHKLTEKLAVQYSYKKTHWNSFRELRATDNNGRVLLQKDKKFNNNSRIALGVSYDVIEALTLRAGIAYDESASVAHPSISIPDTYRTWYTLGATYRFTPNLSVDLSYAHLRGSKNTFTESQVTAVTSAVGEFKVKSTANLYGLNVNYKF